MLPFSRRDRYQSLVLKSLPQHAGPKVQELVSKFKKLPRRTQVLILSVIPSILFLLWLLGGSEGEFAQMGDWIPGSPVKPPAQPLSKVIWRGIFGGGRVVEPFEHGYDWEEEASSRHVYHPNGMLSVDMQSRHPIYDLLLDAEKKWQRKVALASTSLKEAVVEYKRRYNRQPPKGFDIWWQFVVDNKVQLPDEYDQINRDIAPFLGFDPRYLHKQQALWQSTPGTFVITSEDGKVYKSSSKDRHPQEKIVSTRRSEAQLKLLRPIQKYLPEFKATFYTDDVGNQFMYNDLKEQLLEAADRDQYLDVTEYFEGAKVGWEGWRSCCNSTSKLRTEDDTSRERIPSAEDFFKKPKAFVWDHAATMDICTNPDITKEVGFFSAFQNGVGPIKAPKSMVPTFAVCTTSVHSDILSVAMEQYSDAAYADADPVWEKKSNNKLLWRGGNTGILYEDNTKDVWNISQRIRLVTLTNSKQGETYLIESSPPTQHTITTKQHSLATLNQKFMDVLFTKKPIQCDKSYCSKLKKMFSFAKLMKFKEGNSFKYIFDADGNGWSGRFQRLLSTNSLILKATVFPEWYTDRIQPWVHYVPVDNSYTDLYDVMAFLRGDPVTGEGGHDAIAKKIAYAGRDWSDQYWRRVDLTAYMFRLILEYARVMALDREAAAFHFEDE